MAAKYRRSTTVAVGQGFVGFGLLAIGVVASLATVLGFFGSTWWLFDFLANFRAHFAVALVLVALAYSLVFSKTTGLLFIVMAMVNAFVLLPLYLSNPAPATGNDALTVVSFNVGQRASIRDVTFRWIDTVDPDVVVLTNATTDWLRATEFAEPYEFLNGFPADRSDGIAVLAKEGLDAEVIRITGARESVVRIEASIGGDPVAIYAVQSRPASNETDANIRIEYFAEIARMTRQESMPTIVVGDFQSSSWSHTIRALLSDGKLVDSLYGYGIQTTWPADRWAFFRLPFDHLVHSETLTTVDRYLGPELGVEHRPIVVTVARAA